MSERPTVRDRILQEMAESAGRRGADPDEAIVRTAIDMAAGGGRLAHDALDRLIARASPSVETETWEGLSEEAKAELVRFQERLERESMPYRVAREAVIRRALETDNHLPWGAKAGRDDYTTMVPCGPFHRLALAIREMQRHDPRTPSTGQHDKHSKACQHRNSTGQDDG